MSKFDTQNDVEIEYWISMNLRRKKIQGDIAESFSWKQCMSFSFLCHIGQLLFCVMNVSKLGWLGHKWELFVQD